MDKSKNADEVVAAAPSKPGIRKKKSTMRKKLKDIEKPTMQILSLDAPDTPTNELKQERSDDNTKKSPSRKEGDSPDLL